MKNINKFVQLITPEALEKLRWLVLKKFSEEIYGIKYDYYVEDGDSKVYKAVCDAKPYGEDFIIEKKNVLAMYKRGLERA